MTTSNRWLGRSGLLVAYALWIVLVFLCGWVLSSLHGLLLELALTLQLNPWQARALRQLALPVLGLIWLVFIFWLEYALRTASQRRRLWRSVGRVLAVLALCAALVIGVGFVL